MHEISQTNHYTNDLHSAHYLTADLFDRLGVKRPKSSEVNAMQKTWQLLLNTEACKLKPLSDKEARYLCLLMNGRKPDAIASELCVAPCTLRYYRKNILEKTGCSTLYQVISQRLLINHS